MSHRPETTAESFFQAHKDMTVTSEEQARQKQLDFLENMKVFDEMYEDELLVGTHVMSGRWVDTMKTPTTWRSKYTARGYEEPHSDEGCFAATATIQGIRMLLARAVGPSELTRNLLQELSKDMTMRWGMVTDKPQEFLGRSLCRTPQGHTFGVS